MSEKSFGSQRRKTYESKSSQKSSSSSSKGKKKALENPVVDEESKLSQEAYSLAVGANSVIEHTYPFIPISTKFEIVIENKYASLKPDEVAGLYTRYLGISHHYPKEFYYYTQILVQTGSIVLDSTNRTGGEWAFSKIIIKKVISPDDWPGDLFVPREMKNVIPKNFNYFDYMQAWESALYYNNRQRKFSWFLQFQLDEPRKPFPNWFFSWFQDWGLYPIILPIKVEKVFKEFVKTNPSMLMPRLFFTAFYQVPWIVRWEFAIVSRAGERFGENLRIIPWLGRKVLAKWWNKYEFFENHIFKAEGIKSFERQPPQQQASIKKKVVLTELLQDLMDNYSKEELIKQLECIEEKEEPAGSSSESSERAPMEVSFQDSQDPYSQ